MSQSACGISVTFSASTSTAKARYPTTIAGTTISLTSASRRIPPNKITAITTVITAPLMAGGISNADWIDAVKTKLCTALKPNPIVTSSNRL